jgi:hypothetical protein
MNNLFEFFEWDLFTLPTNVIKKLAVLNYYQFYQLKLK